ncbi:formin-binding protein [Coemansia sp. RSA 2607]|nr:formin-binding protein [Coemansia sp. RSA 2607]
MKYSFILGKLGKESTSTSTASPADGGNAAAAGDGDGSVAGTTATGGDMAGDFVSSERFADNFWSPDERCISVLMHKLKSAKQTCSDVQQLVATRAGAEEELGKRLAKLARAALGSEEVGGLRSALRTMRAELETNARAHSELARQLRGEIERPLAAFMADQRDKRRAQTTVIQKIEAERNSLRSQLRKLQDKRRSDTKKVGDLDLQVNGLQGVADPKLRAKLDRVQRQQRETEDEYRGAKARLRDVDRQWFNSWRSACDVFQRLEEQRIEYLKTALWTYTNLVSSSCVADDESMERLRQDLERVSVADDIAEFIHTFGTGAPDPDLADGAADGDADADGDGDAASHRHSTVSDDAAPPSQPVQQQQQQQAPTHVQRASTSASVSAIPAPDHAAYANRSATPSNAYASVSTGGGGTARSASIMAAHAAMARPQTQESLRHPHQQQQQQHQQQRPVSMHAVGGPPPMQQQPQAQAQHIFAGGSANWNSRPASSMQGSIGANNTFRRASNNDMYAMAAGTPPPPQQQQQQPPQQQFVQRTNSQMGVYGAPPMDPRAPSSVGMYRAADGSMHAQQPPMSDASYAMGGYVQPPHLGSPRSRASTFNGAQGSPHQQHISHAHHVSHSHTGQFGTLTAATQMNIPQQPHPNSAPSSPYQHAVNASSRPMSAAGMHASPHAHAHVPPMQYGAVGIVPVAATPQNMYRSATPVQQQQPQQQYANSPAMINRPPTQMSQMHPMAAKTANGGYQTPQPQQHHANSPAAANGAKTADSDKILFYVKVLYDYDAENEKELTIRENDVISVFAVSADGWWDGEMTDRRTGRSVQGTFPSNFTEPISH